MKKSKKMKKEAKKQAKLAAGRSMLKAIAMEAAQRTFSRDFKAELVKVFREEINKHIIQDVRAAAKKMVRTRRSLTDSWEPAW